MRHRFLVVLLAGLVTIVVCGPRALAQEEARAASYPNEPEGHVPWFSHDWQSWPTEHGQRIAASEAGLIRAGRSPQNFELVEDPDAPHGKGKSLRHRQMEGQSSGSTSGTFDLFHPRPDAGDSHRQEDQVKLRSVYRSHWVKFEPDPQTGDWQFGSTHMRTFWWNRYYHSRGWGNVSIASPHHPATRSYRHDYFRGPRFWYYPAEGASAGAVLADPEGRYELGVWYQFEYLWETEGNFGPGEAGMNNSRVRIWVDGELKCDETITQHILTPFANDHFGMVWLGGRTNGELHPRLQDEFMRFGDIYISGVVHEEQ